MPNPSLAFEVSEGVILNDVCGIFASNTDPDYTAPSGSLHLSPSGIWIRGELGWDKFTGLIPRNLAGKLDFSNIKLSHWWSIT